MRQIAALITLLVLVLAMGLTMGCGETKQSAGSELQILDHSGAYTTLGTITMYVVTGTAKNVSDKRLGEFRIDITFYDVNGHVLAYDYVLGRRMDPADDSYLDPGETWAFDTAVDETSIDHYTFGTITCS